MPLTSNSAERKSVVEMKRRDFLINLVMKLQELPEAELVKRAEEILGQEVTVKDGIFRMRPHLEVTLTTRVKR